jgi:hypothetical protein
MPFQSIAVALFLLNAIGGAVCEYAFIGLLSGRLK